MATRQDVEASARGMKPIVGTRREGAPFAHRGFSERSIRNMVTGGIDAPERLLFMTETQLKKIQGVSIQEIRAYRARFINKGSSPSILADLVYHRAMDNGQLIGLLLFGVCAGFVAYVFAALVF